MRPLAYFMTLPGTSLTPSSSMVSREVTDFGFGLFLLVVTLFLIRYHDIDIGHVGLKTQGKATFPSVVKLSYEELHILLSRHEQDDHICRPLGIKEYPAMATAYTIVIVRCEGNALPCVYCFPKYDGYCPAPEELRDASRWDLRVASNSRSYSAAQANSFHTDPIATPSQTLSSDIVASSSSSWTQLSQVTWHQEPSEAYQSTRVRSRSGLSDMDDAPLPMPGQRASLFKAMIYQATMRYAVAPAWLKLNCVRRTRNRFRHGACSVRSIVHCRGSRPVIPTEKNRRVKNCVKGQGVKN